MAFFLKKKKKKELEEEELSAIQKIEWLKYSLGDEKLRSAVFSA